MEKFRFNKTTQKVNETLHDFADGYVRLDIHHIYLSTFLIQILGLRADSTHHGAVVERNIS